MLVKLTRIWSYLRSIDWCDLKKNAAKSVREWRDDQAGGW
jgi:hypothetical protein